MLQVSCQILLTGAHRVGKGTTVEAINKQTGYLHTLIDRGFESNYAFAKLFNRDLDINLTRAINDFFANPTACMVYFSLGADDFELDRIADASRQEQWVGAPKLPYANRELDKLINEVVLMAESMGYHSRILCVTARDSDPAGQASQILKWLQQNQINTGVQ